MMDQAAKWWNLLASCNCGRCNKMLVPSMREGLFESDKHGVLCARCHHVEKDEGKR